MRRTGFTLIEMLVVIAIIAILLGLLIPAIAFARRAAKVADSTTRVGQISAALEIYHNANGVYPELMPDGSLMGPTASANATGLYKALLSVGSDDIKGYSKVDSTGPVYVDKWDKTILYRPARAYPFTIGLPLGDIDGDDPPNSSGFQLWSVGPNGKDERGGGDDIPNWKKKR